MIKIIPFESLGNQNHGWLNARHHFSFSSYYDPERLGYPPLIVWNDDTIKAGTGFPFHPHQNMEIITYIRTGAITHRDNLGNKGRTLAGNIQVMSAGSGIIHSEYNLEKVDTTLFQIWIETAVPNIKPRWDTKPFPANATTTFSLLASGRKADVQNDKLQIYQDAALYAGAFNKGEKVSYNIDIDRHLYLVPSSGKLKINGTDVNERDGVYIFNEEQIVVDSISDSEIVFVDLPLI
ncbi:pirin family protein [Candidatus Neomarinimicrobiota bacterium]